MINVLIAEDDFRIADLHEKFLSHIEGIQVVGKALNAAEAVKIVSKQHVDLILLDIYMPDKLGTDLINELKNQHHHIHFIVITAANHIDFLKESVRNGVFSYLIKPVTLERFTEAIESFIQKKNLLDSRKYVDQEFVDHVFNVYPPKASNHESLPKGIDPLTLNKVMQIMEHFNSGMTTEEMGMKMGASRITARRYLEYLVSIGKVKAELEYGIVGRPERKYFFQR